MILKSFSFLLVCQICWHIIVHSLIYIYIFFFFQYQLFFLFHFLFYLVFSLFFLVSPARGLSNLFTLSKNLVLVLLIFPFPLFLSLLISYLNFINSFLKLPWSFVCSSFSNYFRWWVWLFTWDFLFLKEGLYQHKLFSENYFCHIP